MNCCDPTCGKAVTQEDSYVRVRFDHGDHLPFETTPSGVAVFHETCWQTQLTAKQRTLRAILREANELAEFFDSRARMEESVDHVVELLACSKHAVLFSGAGISTSAGIGDFRGLFGQWTQDERFSNNHILEDDSAADTVPYEELIPTLAHEAVAWLIDQGILQHVITQNCDGLHRLSGIQPDKLSELHGNIFIEYCTECGREYERNFIVENFQANEYFEELEDHGHTKIRKPKRAKQCQRCKLTHHTKRSCRDCKVPLNDTIINFGDFLRDSQMQPATEHSNKADLLLVLGSTVAVTPASDLCDNPENLVICNRQQTQKDKDTTVRIFGDCDVFMELLLSKVMSNKEYETWKQGRAARVKQYRKKRSNNRK